jgi:hypothetical protein
LPAWDRYKENRVLEVSVNEDSDSATSSSTLWVGRRGIPVSGWRSVALAASAADGAEGQCVKCIYQFPVATVANGKERTYMCFWRIEED